MLDERKLDVLRAIVTDYVHSQEPVGSRALVERYQLGVSSATIRNDMAALEDEGYITQPHTSAGRVPTDKGYRLFVDRLSGVKPLSSAERKAISTFLAGALDIDEVMNRTVRLLAQVTHQIAMVQYPVSSSAVVRHIELVSLSVDRGLMVVINSLGRVEQRVMEFPPHDEDTLITLRTKLNAATIGKTPARAAEKLPLILDEIAPEHRPLAARCVSMMLDMLAIDSSTRLVVGGVQNLTGFGADFHHVVSPILAALEEQVVLLKLLSEIPATQDVSVRIGQEISDEKFHATSVVATTYAADDTTGATLGIVGPTRMDYPSTMALVHAVARYVGRYLAEG